MRNRAVPLAVAAVLLFAARAWPQLYPLAPSSICGHGYECWRLIDAWNRAEWDAVVDEKFDPSGQLAAVRHYTTEFPCTGILCADQLERDNTLLTTYDPVSSDFLGVTDELSNVLLSHALGSDQARYQKLRNFAELLRMSDHNHLQCWKYAIQGAGTYQSAADVCKLNDSASDASLRILGAYGIACAKQLAGVWSSTQYCDDYVRQGNAIWGRGTPDHGEVKKLANGEFFLANGYDNAAGAPLSAQSFRPDYYELQFLYDFGEYVNDPTVTNGVTNMLTHFSRALGTNQVARGKNGHFDANASVGSYASDDKCDNNTECLDPIDTWRAVPALSGFYVTHPTAANAAFFDSWWNLYSGGTANLQPGDELPIGIRANAADGGVFQSENSYKTLSMWTPLAVAKSQFWTTNAITNLVGKYDFKHGLFFGAAYYGAYFSSFAQRAVAIATGALDRRVTTRPQPCCLTATAGGTNVTLSWTPGSGEATYEVQRTENGTYSTIGTTSAPHFVDATALSGHAYVYKVRGTAPVTPYTNQVPASLFTFTDDPIIARSTTIKRVHITELRDAINALRRSAALTDFTFRTLGLVAVAQDVADLRTALNDALSALGLPPLESESIALGMTIERWHIQELRDRLR